MRVTFDREADAAYVSLRRIGLGGVASSLLVEGEPACGEIVLDFDRKGCLIGIEVLGARRRLPAKLLEQADPL